MKLLRQLASKNEELKITNSRKNLSDTLARLLLLKENKVQFLTEGNLYDTGFTPENHHQPVSG